MSSTRTGALTLWVALALGGAACGGGETGETAEGAGQPEMAAEPAGAMTVPDWMTVDESARTVTLSIVAGRTDVNNYWNFNGYVSGAATITVPQGYAVTIRLENRDPAMAHSIGVSSLTANFPPMFESPEPVFPGAISSSPTDATRAAQPGQSETISFTAATAGEYSLVCYIPAHALTGMWLRLNVSADGSYGVSIAT